MSEVKITMHCAVCGIVEEIFVDEEMYRGGVDAEMHCGKHMVWSDDDVERITDDDDNHDDEE